MEDEGQGFSFTREDLTEMNIGGGCINYGNITKTMKSMDFVKTVHQK